MTWLAQAAFWSHFSAVMALRAFLVLENLQYLPWAGMWRHYAMQPWYERQNVVFSALRLFALCPRPYGYFISTVVFSLSSFPCFLNIIVRIWDVTQGNRLATSFRSKMTTRFMSYVNDPVQGLIETTTLSDSINKRYIIQHAFAVKPANVLPRRCKRAFTTAPVFLVDGAFS